MGEQLKKVMVCLLVCTVFIMSACAVRNSNTTMGNEHSGYEVTEPIDIIWWHTLDSQYDDFIEKVVSDFNASQPNITVHAEFMGSWSDINEALVAANVAGADLPAVAMCNTKFLAAYGDSGLFEDLNPYIEATNYDVDDFAPGLYSTASYGNKQIAMPFLHNTQVMYYNKTVAKEYNLTIPTEFSELGNFFEEVNEKTGMTALSMQSLDFYYGTIYRNAGVDIITEDNQCDLDSNTACGITSQFQTWCNKGYISWLQGSDASSNMKQEFYDRKTFAVLHNSTALPTYISNADFEVGIAWYPGCDGNYNADLGGGVLGIPSKNDLPTKNAAWVFIEYLCGTELNMAWCENTGYLPTRLSVLDSQATQDYLSVYPEYKTVYDNLELINPPIIHSRASEVVQIWQQYMNEMMLEDADVYDTSTLMTEEINEVLNAS